MCDVQKRISTTFGSLCSSAISLQSSPLSSSAGSLPTGRIMERKSLSLDTLPTKSSAHSRTTWLASASLSRLRQIRAPACAAASSPLLGRRGRVLDGKMDPDITAYHACVMSSPPLRHGVAMLYFSAAIAHGATSICSPMYTFVVPRRGAQLAKWVNIVFVFLFMK